MAGSLKHSRRLSAKAFSSSCRPGCVIFDSRAAFSLACVAYIESVDHAGSQVMQAVKSCRQSTLSVTPKPPPPPLPHP